MYFLFRWGSELRRITVVFVNLGFDVTDLSLMTDKFLQAQRLNRVVRAVQHSVYLYEGYVTTTSSKFTLLRRFSHFYFSCYC